MNIFFDLDGTLIESRPRLYQLFQFLIPDSVLSFDEYWDLKRNKINHKDILTSKFNYSEEHYIHFEQKWMLEIEEERWLNLDHPFEGVTDFLIQLNQKNNLFLVTARQSKESAFNQVKKFGWENIFSDILVTEQKQEKHLLIKNVVQLNHTDWIVGDTGKDIQTGKYLGINTAAVLTGFLNEESLMGYLPDKILKNVLELNANELL
jgi:phosphoglycolate phosphatase